MARVVTVPPVDGTNKSTDVLVCDGVGDFHRFLTSTTQNDYRAYEYVQRESNDFSGRDWDSAMRALAAGDTANVAAAEAMEREVEHLLNWSSRKHATVNSVAGGGALNVGAWLAGQPNIVRTRVRVESDRAPLTIVAANNMAAGVSTRSLVRRGTAILALVRLLSATRPVTLWSVATSPVEGPHNTGIAIKIETAPLMLGHASFMLTDPAFPRRLGFAARVTVNDKVHGSGGGFLPFGGSSVAAKSIGGAIMCGALGTKVEDTLYLPRAGESDDGGLTANPVAWLERMLAQYGRSGEGSE